MKFRGDAHIRFREGTDIPVKLLNHKYESQRFFAMNLAEDPPRPCGHFHRDFDTAEQCTGGACQVYKVDPNGWINTAEEP